MVRGPELFQEVERLLANSDFEVVDVQTTGSSRGLIVQILLDKTGGISLEDCARVSRAVGDHFDLEETVSGRYVLEVSSPGVDRPLRKPEDFARFSGEKAQVSTYEKIDGRHKHTGLLVGYDSDRNAVLLKGEEEEAIAIPLGAIKKANLKRDPWVPTAGKKK